MNQQGVTVYQGTQPIQAQTTRPTVVPALQDSGTLPYGQSHKRLGIIQMCIGSLCVILSIIGYCVGYYGNLYGFYAIYYSGGGIYTGVFYIVAGLLGFLAYQKNNKCLVVACMVMNILATLVTVIGLIFLSVQLYPLNRSAYGKYQFQIIKCAVIIVCCVIEFVITIVHAAFSCASSCRCCLPRQGITRPLVVQQVPQVTVIPGQTYQLPQQQSVIVQHHQPRHMVAQQQQFTHGTPQQQMYTENNPQQTVASAYNAQQDAYQFHDNRALLHNAGMEGPPPYSEVSVEK